LLVRARSERERIGDWSRLLFDQAVLAEGGQLEDPAGFVRRMNAMLVAAPAAPGACGAPNATAAPPASDTPASDTPAGAG